jgi:tripartite-type tricarboxylate transporter receptor subunit TctC
MRRRAYARLLVGGLCCVVAQATAQGYPSRAIRVIIPYPPGGGSDMLIRPIAARVTESLGQQLIMDNRPGGGSVIGTQLAAKSAPDGYTVLIVDLAYYANPTLLTKLPYDSVRDLAPVVNLASSAVILVVHPSLPARNLKELIALAKARPGEIHYASGGNGTGSHLGAELLKLAAGINLIHVPYKGVAPALTDTLAGQVTVTFAGVNSARAFMEAGRLRALAISGTARKAAVPNVPTFAELGYPVMDATTHRGLLVPTGTPAEVITRLNTEFNKALATPALRTRLEELGYDATGGTASEYGALVRAEISKWEAVIRKAGIRIE